MNNSIFQMGRMTNGYLLMLVSAAGALSLPATLNAKQKVENVVLIVADDMGCQVSGLGTTGLKTPNIDRLMSKGMAFTRAFSVSASSAPSRSSMLTGMYPHSNGHWRNTFEPEIDAPDSDFLRTGKLQDIVGVYEWVQTLPEILNAQGFYTAITRKLHLSYPWKYPFQQRIKLANTPSVYFSSTKEVVKAAAGRPFFLQTNLTPPHRPWPQTAKNYRGPLPPREQIEMLPTMPDLPEVRKDMQEYYINIMVADQMVGRVIDALQETGVMDKTLVIFVSDQGPSFHGAKASPYYLGSHIPLVISGPGFRRNVVNNSLVSMIDLYPTILEALGIPLPDQSQGKSLIPILTGRSDSVEGRNYIFTTHNSHGPSKAEFYPARAIFDGRYWLVRNLRPDKDFPLAADMKGSGPPWFNLTYDAVVANKDKVPEYYKKLVELEGKHPEYELYDMEADPGQFDNLYGLSGYGQIAQRLSSAMEEWRKETGDSEELIKSMEDSFGKPIPYAVEMARRKNKGNMKRVLLYGLWLLPALCRGGGMSQPDQSTLVAVDALGREVGEATTPPRADRTVGMFYFIWHGAHTNDKFPRPPGTPNLPYDNTKILKANPSNPIYGPVHAFHHWGEPRFGYYLSDDRWVIRKHAQMLSDIGVDVIVLDVTNALLYMDKVNAICRTYLQMRKEGSRTPQIAFMINSKPEATMKMLYEEFYARGLFKELWFVWKGKPLVLCPPEGVTPRIAEFFSVRHAWFGAKVGKWFGDGRDKWTWADLYPQTAGWHESPDIPEEVSIAPATHATAGIGRSSRDGKPSEPTNSGEGLFFSLQADRALEIDPEFLFITGWNEWIAMRFTDEKSKRMLGKPITKGDTYFVDSYNAEYSRDIEPVRGDFEDNYYYQTAGIIRRFKGGNTVREVCPVKGFAADGNFAKWEDNYPLYRDDAGDTFHRDHAAWGDLPRYVNNTGRNDIVAASVAVSGGNILFYVRTAEPITSYESPDWMRLYIRTGEEPQWEGYRYAVNIEAARKKSLILSECAGGWNWKRKAEVPYVLKGDRMELSIPLKAMGLDPGAPFQIDFKWVDNGGENGDILMWLDHGDAAPNARFRYRYKYSGT